MTHQQYSRYLLKLISQNSCPQLRHWLFWKLLCINCGTLKWFGRDGLVSLDGAQGDQLFVRLVNKFSADILRGSNHLVMVDKRSDGLGFFVKYISFPIFQLYLFICSGFDEKCIVFQLYMIAYILLLELLFSNWICTNVCHKPSLRKLRKPNLV